MAKWLLMESSEIVSKRWGNDNSQELDKGGKRMMRMRPRIIWGLLMILLISSIPTTSWAGEISASAEIISVKGFGVNIMIDQPEYYTTSPSRPPVINMALQVYNYSRIPVTLDFTTSQRYDFAIYNSKGREVWRWSDDKAFLQVLGQVTLSPGESILYTTAYEFIDANGRPMPADLYTLKGELTASDMTLWTPRKIEGTVSFWHKHTR